VPNSQGQVSVNRSHKEVIVIIHKAKGMAEPIVSSNHIFEDREKLSSVTIIIKDRRMCIASGSNMINSSRIFDSEWSGHDPR
jgi:hypothetical protein